MKKEIKVRKRETGRKMFGEQFINNKEPSHTLKDRTFFFTTLAKKFNISLTFQQLKVCCSKNYKIFLKWIHQINRGSQSLIVFS